MAYRSARGQCTIEALVMFLLLFSFVLTAEHMATRSQKLLPQVQLSRGSK